MAVSYVVETEGVPERSVQQPPRCMHFVVYCEELCIRRQLAFGVEGPLRPNPLGDEAAESDQVDLYGAFEGQGRDPAFV